MWNNKKKAVTFSFDDGVTQDERAIEILNRYGLRATFNINSSLLGLPGELRPQGVLVNHSKISPARAPRVYAEHEVAVHTLTHPNLTTLDKETVVYQVEEDRLALERLFGQKVVGMAYPCGGVNNDDRTAAIIREHTGVRYARTITSTHAFGLPQNLHRLAPSVYYIEKQTLFDLAKDFLALSPDTPQMFYIWGHTYEMDAGFITWEEFEEFCALISGREDIFYGTNTEVLSPLF